MKMSLDIEYTVSNLDYPGYQLLRLLMLAFIRNVGPYNFENNSPVQPSYDFIVGEFLWWLSAKSSTIWHIFHYIMNQKLTIPPPPLHIQIHRFKRSFTVMSYNFLDCFVTRSIIYVVLLHSVFEFPAVVCS